MAEHRTQLGLPAREDYIFVAKSSEETEIVNSTPFCSNRMLIIVFVKFFFQTDAGEDDSEQRKLHGSRNSAARDRKRWRYNGRCSRLARWSRSLHALNFNYT